MELSMLAYATLCILLAGVASAQTTTQEHSTIASTSVLSLGSGEDFITQSQAGEHNIQIAVALLGSYLPESLSKAQDEGQAVTFFLPRDAVFPEYSGDLIELIRSWRRDLFDEDLKGWLRSATIQEALSASDLAARGIVLTAYPPMARTRHQGRRQDQSKEKEARILSSLKLPNAYIHTTDALVRGISENAANVAQDAANTASQQPQDTHYRFSRRSRRSRRLSQESLTGLLNQVTGGQSNNIPGLNNIAGTVDGLANLVPGRPAAPPPQRPPSPPPPSPPPPTPTPTTRPPPPPGNPPPFRPPSPPPPILTPQPTAGPPPPVVTNPPATPSPTAPAPLALETLMAGLAPSPAATPAPTPPAPPPPSPPPPATPNPTLATPPTVEVPESPTPPPAVAMESPETSPPIPASSPLPANVPLPASTVLPEGTTASVASPESGPPSQPPAASAAVSGPGVQNNTADSVTDAPGPSSERPVIITVSPAVAPAETDSSATGTVPPPAAAPVAALEPPTAGLPNEQAEAPVATNAQSPQLSTVGSLEPSPAAPPPTATPEPTVAAEAPVLPPSEPPAVASGAGFSGASPQPAEVSNPATAEAPSGPPAFNAVENPVSAPPVESPGPESVAQAASTVSGPPTPTPVEGPVPEPPAESPEPSASEIAAPTPSAATTQSVGAIGSGNSARGQQPPKQESNTGAIVGGVLGGVGGGAALGGLAAYFYRRGRKSNSSDSSNGRASRKEERAAWAANHAQNRKDWNEARAANRADVREARAMWLAGKWGGGQKSFAASGISDEKGFRAGTGPTDLEKLVGGQNKGIAQLHSFAAIDSTLTSSTTASRSHGYDLMGTQRIDVINADSQRSVIPVAVQDSAESYDASSAERSALAAMEEDSWQINAEDVTICKTPEGNDIMIGQGGFGSVYLGELFSSTQVAVKVLKSRDARSREAFLNEMSILKSLHHSNIVQFLGACLLQNTVALVTEFMPQGDLWHALSNDQGKELSYYKRGRSIALDIARGTIYMHSKKIIHLDLKSANILLARDGSAKIADVGLAKIMSRELTQVSARGSFDWVAPEVLRGDEVNDRADMWSLAVLLWEICSGERPQNRFIRELRTPEECPKEISNLIAKCRLEPQDRPSAKEFYETLRQAPVSLEDCATPQLPQPPTTQPPSLFSRRPESLPGASSIAPKSTAGTSSRPPASFSTSGQPAKPASRKVSPPPSQHFSSSAESLRSSSRAPGSDSTSATTNEGPRSGAPSSSERSAKFVVPEIPPYQGPPSSSSSRRSRRSQAWSGPMGSSSRRATRPSTSISISPFVKVEGSGSIAQSADQGTQSLLSTHDSGQMTDGTRQSAGSKGKKPSPFASSETQDQPLSSFWDSRSSWASARRP